MSNAQFQLNGLSGGAGKNDARSGVVAPCYNPDFNVWTVGARTEPVHDFAIEIGQAQEANRDVPRFGRPAGELLLTLGAGDDILAEFGAVAAEGRESALPD